MRFSQAGGVSVPCSLGLADGAAQGELYEQGMEVVKWLELDLVRHAVAVLDGDGDCHLGAVGLELPM